MVCAAYLHMASSSLMVLIVHRNQRVDMALVLPFYTMFLKMFFVVAVQSFIFIFLFF